jgi:hypothetical protein
MSVVNGSPLGSSLLLPVCTLNCVQTLKGSEVLDHLAAALRAGVSLTVSAAGLHDSTVLAFEQNLAREDAVGVHAFAPR